MYRHRGELEAHQPYRAAGVVPAHHEIIGYVRHSKESEELVVSTSVDPPKAMFGFEGMIKHDDFRKSFYVFIE